MPPAGVAEAGAVPIAAWEAACRAIAAAAAAASRVQLVRLASALRVADVAPDALAADDDVAAVRNGAARCEASALALARACGHGHGFRDWPPPRAATDAANAFHRGNVVAGTVTAAANAASADAAMLQLLVDALWA